MSPYPCFGPPCDRSNTCLGLSSHWNLWSSFAPWFPPLLGLMNTSSGFICGEGIGLITNGLWSWLFLRFTDAFFFLRIEDLKEPCGNITPTNYIHFKLTWATKIIIDEIGPKYILVQFNWLLLQSVRMYLYMLTKNFFVNKFKSYSTKKTKTEKNWYIRINIWFHLHNDLCFI